MKALTMPFGKYKGTAIDELPNDYLCYIAVSMRYWLNPHSRFTEDYDPDGRRAAEMQSIAMCLKDEMEDRIGSGVIKVKGRMPREYLKLTHEQQAALRLLSQGRVRPKISRVRATFIQLRAMNLALCTVRGDGYHYIITATGRKWLEAHK